MRMCISNTPILKPACIKYTRKCVYGHVTHALMHSLELVVCVSIWKSYIPIYACVLYIFMHVIFTYTLYKYFIYIHAYMQAHTYIECKCAHICKNTYI